MPKKNYAERLRETNEMDDETLRSTIRSRDHDGEDTGIARRVYRSRNNNNDYVHHSTPIEDESGDYFDED
jgi:hypothetical protein